MKKRYVDTQISNEDKPNLDAQIRGKSVEEELDRDSSTSMTNSGELLSDSNTVDDTEETMPRLNTDNL